MRKSRADEQQITALNNELLNVKFKLHELFSKPYVDPAIFFKSSSYYARCADSLNKGSNIIGLNDLNERELNRYRIERFTGNFPKTIVLGSSRVMIINSSLLERNIYNLGVSGGSIEDIIAFANLIQSSHYVIDTLILEVYPWIFNSNNNQHSWVINEGLLPSFKNHFWAYYKNKFDAVKSLIDPSYFKLSSRNFKKRISGDNKAYFSRQSESHSKIIFADGSIRYDSAYRQQNIDVMISKFIADGLYSFKDYDRIDPGTFEKFSQLLVWIKKFTKVVYLYKSPYPPEIESYLYNGKYSSLMKQIDSEIARLSAKNSMPVVGSYKSSELNLNKTYFYDVMHCKESVIKQILRPHL